MRSSAFQKYLLPGFVFQSVVIAGGYGSLLAKVGLVDLIAKGYGTLTWAFLVVFVAPVLTWGIWKISVQAGRS